MLLDNVQDDPDEPPPILIDPPGTVLEPQDECLEGQIASIESSSHPPEECGNNGDIPFIPKGRSISHHLIDDKELCLLSLDIENRVEHFGLLQLSAEVCKVCIIPTSK